MFLITLIGWGVCFRIGQRIGDKRRAAGQMGGRAETEKGGEGPGRAEKS